MGKSVSAPPPVNYTAAAQAQGAANVDAARTTARLSNPNVYGPLGSQTVTYGAFDQGGYDKAMAAYNAAGNQGTYDEAGNFTPSGTAPTREQFTANQDTPTITQTLNPNAQKTLDAQQQVDLALANLGVQGIGTAQQVLGTPFKYTGPDIQTNLGNTGGIDTNPNLNQYGQAGANVQAGPVSGAPDITGMGRAQGFNPATMGMAGGFNPAQYGQAGGANLSRFGQAGGLGSGASLARDASGNAASADASMFSQAGGQNGQANLDVENGASQNRPNQYQTMMQTPQGRQQMASMLGMPESQVMQMLGGISGQQGGASPSGVQGVDYGPRSGSYGYAQGGPQAGQYGYAQGSLGPQQQATGGPAAGLFGLQQGGVQGPQLQSQIDTGGPVNGGPAAGQYGYAQGGPSGPQLQQSLDTSNLAAMPVNAGMTAQNAILSRLMPSIQAQRSQLETQLANQGLVRGGEAYNAAVSGQGMKENDLMTQAALQGLNLDMSARQQGLGEQQALGSFGNQAALSQFGAGQQGNQAQNAAMAQNYAQAQSAAQQGNAAQQQQFTQRVQAGEFGNQAQLASFSANLQNQQAGNQAASNNFAQAQAAAQMGNQAAGQNYAQALGAGQFANQAVGQNFAQGQQANQAANAAVGQNFNQGMQASQQSNAAAQQLFSQMMGAQGLQNQAVQQNQQMALAQQQLANQAVGQNQQAGYQAAQLGNAAIGQNQQAGFQAAQLGNSALGANQQAALAQQQAANQAQQQGFGQSMDVQGLYNQSIAQNQQARLQQQTASNAAQNQQFNQQLAAGQFGNTAAQQALQQQLSLYNQPLNQIAALMSGSQVQMPQFQGYTGANVAAAPVFQGVQAGAQDAMQRYNAQQSAANAMTSGLFSLGGAALGGAGTAAAGGATGGLAALFSDRRLKSNIERVGTHPLGIGIYEYDIFGKRERGVMAQEVQHIKPEAVLQHPSGFLMVNYGAL